MSDDDPFDGDAVQNPPISLVFSAKESSFEGANDEDLRLRLGLLEEEHRDLDAAILAMESSSFPDRLAIARFKKKKLQLKDIIKAVREKITPDIIA